MDWSARALISIIPGTYNHGSQVIAPIVVRVRASCFQRLPNNKYMQEREDLYGPLPDRRLRQFDSNTGAKSRIS